jgi:hypothetical protein
MYKTAIGNIEPERRILETAQFSLGNTGLFR